MELRVSNTALAVYSIAYVLTLTTGMAKGLSTLKALSTLFQYFWSPPPQRTSAVLDDLVIGNSSSSSNQQAVNESNMPFMVLVENVTEAPSFKCSAAVACSEHEVAVLDNLVFESSSSSSNQQAVNESNLSFMVLVENVSEAPSFKYAAAVACSEHEVAVAVEQPIIKQQNQSKQQAESLSSSSFSSKISPPSPSLPEESLSTSSMLLSLLAPSQEATPQKTCNNIGLSCEGFFKEGDAMADFGGGDAYSANMIINEDLHEEETTFAYSAGVVPPQNHHAYYYQQQPHQQYQEQYQQFEQQDAAQNYHMRKTSNKSKMRIKDLQLGLRYQSDSVLVHRNSCLFQSIYVEQHNPLHFVAPKIDMNTLGCTRSPTLA
eukprot:CAMPEP_0198143986 /NCGR_PEP_ID=MMETSP1443-20131203/12344_1 /TAXON_ID=186043 /ORGANISM="Entomoneis sp., Strain CCMP2396" /LENGTH=374 /DNA_ID=CAMNT_0043807303 /DNA_START=92 /DNA_END=1213 /DNA_ORIENTATION=+